MSTWLREARDCVSLPSYDSGPLNIGDAIVLALPVAIIALAQLSTGAVRAWLLRNGIQHPVSSSERQLHGCLISRCGVAVIFVEATDDENERRFSIAHELAHFILEILIPRRKAVAEFGESIIDVLDGLRPPTYEESISALLRRVSALGTRVHLMPRGDSGKITSWEIEEAEQRADRLALEFLAPPPHVLAAASACFGGTPSLDDAGAFLISRYGLPNVVALDYAEQLFYRRERRSNVVDLFRDE